MGPDCGWLASEVMALLLTAPPPRRASRCFSINWLTMASTVSAVDTSSSLFRFGSSSLKTRGPETVDRNTISENSRQPSHWRKSHEQSLMQRFFPVGTRFHMCQWNTGMNYAQSNRSKLAEWKRKFQDWSCNKRFVMCLCFVMQSYFGFYGQALNFHTNNWWQNSQKNLLKSWNLSSAHFETC